MATKTLKQTRTFNADAMDLYDLLMDSKKHSKMTGAKAKISSKVGGAFSAWDGYCSGENIELVPGEKIVQTWRGSDWPEGVVSRTTYSFASVGPGKTKLTFTQSGIPEQEYEGVKQGWIDFYWDPMANIVSQKTK